MSRSFLLFLLSLHFFPLLFLLFLLSLLFFPLFFPLFSYITA